MTYEPVEPNALKVLGMPIALVPWPRMVETIPNTTVSLSGGVVCVDEDVPDGAFLARELCHDLAAATGCRWDPACGPWEAEVHLGLDSSLSPCSYTLEIFDGSVTIHGGDCEGLRDGVQTARQLVRQTCGLLPVVRIQDEPALPVRGYYLDVTRGRVPGMDWLKRWVDELELCKYNQLHLYIEHSFAFPSLSEAWRGKDPLRPEEIMEFDAYCAERGIELVPSVSTFGHLYEVLRTHGLRHLGEFPEDADRPFSFIERQEHHTLNILLDEAFELSARMIDEYLPLFSSRKFNLGADETFDLGKGRSKAEAAERGVGAMYVDYVNRLCAHVAAKGHEPMLWADVALEHLETLTSLDDHATLLNWQYAPDVTDEKFRVLAEAGVRQYVCPAVIGWNHLLPPVTNPWRNISSVASYGIRHGATGFLLTDWGDYGHVNDPRLSRPAMMIGAECAWNPDTPGFDNVTRRISRLLFVDADGAVLRAWDRAEHDSAFTWYDVVRLLELDLGGGELNLDVQAVFGTIGGADERAVANAGDLETARRLFLTALAPRLASVPGAKGALRTVQEAVAESGVHLTDETARILMRACVGQDLLDETGHRLAVDAGVLPAGAPIRPACEVAGDLECWFESYRDLWREICKESELDRVGSVVWRLADMLRAIDAKEA